MCVVKTMVRLVVTIKCGGPTCGTVKDFIKDNFLEEEEENTEDPFADCEGWLFSDVQDLCPDCLKIQQRMIGKSQWNYISAAPKEEVEKFLDGACNK